MSYSIIDGYIPVEDDVIVLITRNCVIPYPFNRNVHVEAFPWHRSSVDKFLNMLDKRHIMATRRTLVKCRNYIDGIIKDRPFVMYIPTTFEFSIGCFLENKLCRGYFFIEEGGLSYRATPDTGLINNFKRWISRVVYGIPYNKMLAVMPHFQGVFATNESAFPWCENNRTIVPIKFRDTPGLGSVKAMVVFSHLNTDIPTLAHLITKTANYLNTKNILGEYVCYKLHPGSHDKPEKEQIVRDMMNEYGYVELSKETILEACLMKSKPLVISVGIESSVAIYGRRFGCECLIIPIS
jgi:hypothetical protein